MHSNANKYIKILPAFGNTRTSTGSADLLCSKLKFLIWFMFAAWERMLFVRITRARCDVRARKQAKANRCKQGYPCGTRGLPEKLPWSTRGVPSGTPGVPQGYPRGTLGDPRGPLRIPGGSPGAPEGIFGQLGDMRWKLLISARVTLKWLLGPVFPKTG